MISEGYISKNRYRGRFAPTPSGPLHLGSLLTAVASYLAARCASGVWLLRIDDLDRARCPAGAEAVILRQLEAHGLLWEETPRRQTEHLDEYLAALRQLERDDLTYLCICTRHQLKQTARHGPDGAAYPGTCRRKGHRGRGAIRVCVKERELCFDDGWQGRQCRNLVAEVGDFVIRRANGEFAYQLACAVDEERQAITEVIRGVDLLGSTFQQRYLQELLGFFPPRYRHLPVLVDRAGRKLSKQNHALPVGVDHASANLHACLQLLGLMPPSSLAGEPPEQILRWGVDHWHAAKLPRGAQIAGPSLYNAAQQFRPTPP